MITLNHELFSSFQVVKLSRSAVVKLIRFRVINFTGFCNCNFAAIIKEKVRYYE